MGQVITVDPGGPRCSPTSTGPPGAATAAGLPPSPGGRGWARTPRPHRAKQAHPALRHHRRPTCGPNTAAPPRQTGPPRPAASSTPHVGPNTATRPRPTGPPPAPHRPRPAPAPAGDRPTPAAHPPSSPTDHASHRDARAERNVTDAGASPPAPLLDELFHGFAAAADRPGRRLRPPDPLPIRPGSAARSCDLRHPPGPVIDGTASWNNPSRRRPGRRSARARARAPPR